MIAKLLENQAELDSEAQDILLADVEKQFTEEDNIMLTAVPTKEEVKESVESSNLHAAPGTDGITTFLYKECFHILGDSLTDVCKAVHGGEQPTQSQRTSLMLCSTKPGKAKSLKVKDKRRLSLLNADFKVMTGLEVGRFRQVLDHTFLLSRLPWGKTGGLV